MSGKENKVSSPFETIHFRRCFFCDVESTIPVIVPDGGFLGVYNDGYIICDLCRDRIVSKPSRVRADSTTRDM